MLALREYFWNWGGTPAPLPVVVPSTPPRGSGKSTATTEENYRVLPDEYWEARASQTAPQKIAPEVLKERTARLHEEVRRILDEQQQISLLRQNYAAVLFSLKNVTSIANMQTLSEQSKNLKAQLAELEATNKARIIRAQMLRESLKD